MGPRGIPARGVRKRGQRGDGESPRQVRPSLTTSPGASRIGVADGDDYYDGDRGLAGPREIAENSSKESGAEQSGQVMCSGRVAEAICENRMEFRAKRTGECYLYLEREGHCTPSGFQPAPTTQERSMDLAKNLKIDSVSRLHPTAPRQVTVKQTVADAVNVMRQERVGCVLVCDDEGKLIGIFTERDLLRRVLATGKPLSIAVSECMTPDPVALDPKDSIGAAVRRMAEGGYRHLPVIDADRRPVGILSVKKIMHYLVEHFPATIYNLPPDPNTVPHQREGA